MKDGGGSVGMLIDVASFQLLDISAVCNILFML
jgi:hypothetical protein